MINDPAEMTSLCAAVCAEIRPRHAQIEIRQARGKLADKLFNEDLIEVAKENNLAASQNLQIFLEIENDKII